MVKFLSALCSVFIFIQRLKNFQSFPPSAHMSVLMKLLLLFQSTSLQNFLSLEFSLSSRVSFLISVLDLIVGHLKLLDVRETKDE